MNRGIHLDDSSALLEPGIRIIFAVSNSEKFEISKYGVLIPLKDQILEDSSINPRPIRSDKISISKTQGLSPFSISIDLPSNQKVNVSKELRDCSISIYVFRVYEDFWFSTNIAMLVLGGTENVLYQDKRFLTEVNEKQNEIPVEELPPKKFAIEVVEEKQISEDLDPIIRKFRVKAITRRLAFAFAIVFAFVAVTPLAFVHPNKLENQKSSIYLIWPSENPAVGSEVLVVDEDQLVFVAKVHSDDGGIIILQIDEYFVEITSDQVIGKKVISIQSPAQWFD